MSPKKAILIIVVSALLTACVAALLMNIVERKREGDRLAVHAHRRVAHTSTAS